MKKTDEATGRKENTIKEVAERAGVSQATVGRVVGGYGSVSKKTYEKVYKVIKEMGYVPNAIAQSMKSKSTKTIGVIVGNIANPFFSEIVYAIENRIAEAGFNLIISNTGEDVRREILSLEILHSKRVDGLIIATTQLSNKIFNEVEKKLYCGFIPTVYIDREIFSVNELCVKTDNFGGAYDAVSDFIRKGHKNIGIIAGVPTSTMEQRVDGYRKALSDHGIKFNEEFIRFSKIASIEEGKQFTKELLQKNKEITALFPLNNLICTGTLIALNEMNLRIPSNISLIGWDDFPLAAINNPPISMITQDTEKIGFLAAEKLLEIINSKECGNDLFGEKRITLKTHFIHRESCAKI